MSSPSPVNTTRYPGAIGILSAIAFTLFIASPRGNPSRLAERTTSRVSACRWISDGVSLIVYVATSPNGMRDAPSGPRFTGGGKAVLRDVVLQRHLEVDDPGELPDLAFQGRRVPLEQADVLPAHGHVERLLPGDPPHLADRRAHPRGGA